MTRRGSFRHVHVPPSSAVSTPPGISPSPRVIRVVNGNPGFKACRVPATAQARAGPAMKPFDAPGPHACEEPSGDGARGTRSMEPFAGWATSETSPCTAAAFWRGSSGPGSKAAEGRSSN